MRQLVTLNMGDGFRLKKDAHAPKAGLDEDALFEDFRQALKAG